MELDLAGYRPLIAAFETAGLPLLSGLVATALGPAGVLVGPGLSMLVPAVNKALGLDADATPQQAADVIVADPASAKDKLAAVQEDHAYLLQSAKQVQDFQLASQAQQMAVVTADAASQSWFVRGWRPAVCWGLFLNLMAIVFVPWLVWIALCFAVRLPDPPATNTDLVIGMISALLGLGALRSYDKARETTTGRKSTPVAGFAMTKRV